MNSRVTPLHTPAETAFIEAYLSARETLPGNGAVQEARARAFDVFRLRGLPHRRLESWHYTDLRAHLREAFPLDRVEGGIPSAPSSDPMLHIAFVDGAPIMPVGTLPEGLRVAPLRDVLATADDSRIAQLFPEGGADDPMVALNAALAVNGMVIEVAPGAQIAIPVRLNFTAPNGAPRGDVSRTLIVVGEGAKLVVAEVHEAQARSQRNSVLIARLAKGARLEHVIELGVDAAELQVATLIADIAEHARLRTFGLIAGGQFIRRQLFICCGEQSKTAIGGISLLDGTRHADTTLVVDHAHPHAESREYFKHVVDDAATGVFQGKIVVRPHAQKIDGGMKSQAILLSDDAAMYNKPELEIFADDVVCGHGATVGQLDEQQLFYLMARGLPRREAEALLLEGFARDAIETVPNPMLKDRLDTCLTRWLERRA